MRCVARAIFTSRRIGDPFTASNSQRASASLQRLSHSPRMIATGARTRAGSACGIGIEITLAPLVEMPPGKDGRLAFRHVRDEAVPLVLERNQPPAWQMLRVATTRPLRDRTEKNEAIDQRGTAPGEAARHDGTPGMGDQRDALDAMKGGDESCGLLELAARILGGTQRCMALGRLSHFRVGDG